MQYYKSKIQDIFVVIYENNINWLSEDYLSAMEHLIYWSIFVVLEYF